MNLFVGKVHTRIFCFFIDETDTPWHYARCATTVLCSPLGWSSRLMLLPLVYNAIVYTMTGQPLEWIRFGQFSLVMALAALIAQSTGLLIGASCSIQTAVFLGPVTMMPAILFCGFFVDHQQLPVWLGWISRLSFTRYGFEALVLSVLGHGRSPLKCSQPYCHYRRPRKFLQELSLSESGYWVDVGVLVLIAVLLRCIGYLVLRWKVTRKR